MYNKLKLIIPLMVLFSAGMEGAEHSAESEDSESCTIVKAGDIDGVKRLLAEGQEVNKADKEGLTLLYYAACEGQIDIARILLAAGAGVNEPVGKDCNSPLQAAAANGHAEMVRFLLGQGAGVNVTDKHGCCYPLKLAAHFGHVETVKLLLEAGAKVQTRDEKKLKPPSGFGLCYGSGIQSCRDGSKKRGSQSFYCTALCGSKRSP